MRLSLAFSLLLLSFLFYNAKGIRLERGFMQVQHKIEEPSDGGLGKVNLCKEEHCKGLNRKLTTVSSSPTTVSTTSSKNEKNGGNKSEASGGHEKLRINSSEHEETSDDVDIMDYSPAKRKPPIHN